MASSGWEIRPAGWLLLAAAALVGIYFIVVSLRKPPGENRQNPA